MLGGDNGRSGSGFNNSDRKFLGGLHRCNPAAGQHDKQLSLKPESFQA